MTKRRDRTLVELLKVTEQISVAEMTPVLEGNCRIQGPMNETDATEKKTSSSQPGKGFGKHTGATKVSMRAESGTCNACAAPCSSCRHFNQTVSCMAIKAENEFSDEVSRVNAATGSSFNNASMMPSLKKRARTDRKAATRETSNILSASSSHDSISESAESKASFKTFDTKDDVEMIGNITLGRADAHEQLLSKPHGVTGQNISTSSKHDVAIDMGPAKQYGVSNGCNADDLSCVSGGNDEGLENVCHVQSDTDQSSGSQFEQKDNFNNSKAASIFSEEFKTKDQVISSSCENLLQKSNPADSRGFEKDFCSNHQIESSVVAIGAQFSDTHKSEDMLNLERSSVSPKSPIDQDSALKSQSVVDVSDGSLKSQSGVDVSEGSDLVENDVEICDICGDAGREDCLAMCSRCSDGAEHTYCMKIMMEEVPKGDWLCEVCQFKEKEADKQKKLKCGKLLGTLKGSCLNEKNKKSVTLNPKITMKLDTEFRDGETNRVTKLFSSTRLPSKRHSDNLEVPSVAKRQALESSSDLPKPSSPSKTNMLSRERSFKNLDMGTTKPIHSKPSFAGSSSQETANTLATSVQHSSKMHSVLQSPRGTLVKSNSFNTSNLKPKVKMVQEEIPQKSKVGKHAFTNVSEKEGIAKIVGRSSSFNIGSSHSGSIDYKAKAHSSSFSRSDDSKGIKLGKEGNILERKSSLKSDRLVSPRSGLNVSSLKDERKASPHGEIPSSKSTSLFPPRGSEAPNLLGGRGDFKRQSSLVSRGGSTEQKLSQVNAKDVVVANLSSNAEASSNNSDLVQLDSVPMSRESMNNEKQCEEPSLNQPRQSLPVGKRTRCDKCKEIGHAAQFCPNSSIRLSILEATAARTSRELMNRGTKLKEATETASVKKSRICKRSVDQADELSMATTESISEMARKDQLSDSAVCLENLPSSDGAYGKQGSAKTSDLNFSRSVAVTCVNHDPLPPCTGEARAPKTVDLNAVPSSDGSAKTSDLNFSRSVAVTFVNHDPLPPCTGEACAPKTVDLNAVPSSDGDLLRPSLCALQNQDSSVFVPSRVFSIPEQDYIWQGGFEVNRGGRHLDIFDGIQAHLSTSASPRVLEVVNKLSRNLLLEEVPRSSTWPAQFQNCATEDNIALYFFAKDVESYHRSYQSLVENMMKKDLAFKGLLDGIELLIFPSNQLCEKSKQWNRLYFLWGVFRAKRVKLSEKTDGSLEDINIMPLKEQLPTFGSSSSAQEAISSTAPFSGKVVTNTCKEGPHFGQKCLSLESSKSFGQTDVSNSLLMIPTSDARLRTNIKEHDTSMLEHGCRGSKEETKLGQCIQLARENISLSEGKVLLDNSNSRRLGLPSPTMQKREACSGSVSLYPDEASSLSLDTCVGGSRTEVIARESMKEKSRYEVTHQGKGKNEEGVADADYVVGNEHDNVAVKSSQKRPLSTMIEMVPKASAESSACTGQMALCKEKTDCTSVDGNNEYTAMKRVRNNRYSSDGFRGHTSLAKRYSSQMLDQALSFPVKEPRLEESYANKFALGGFMTSEKYFFPVELGPIGNVGAICDSIPVQVISSDDEEQLEPERPNLDLVLGGEKKSPKTGNWFELLEHKNNDQSKCPEMATENEVDESVGSLSLSLAAPFSSKTVVPTVKPVAKPELEKSQRDTSLFLFGSFSGT